MCKQLVRATVVNATMVFQEGFAFFIAIRLSSHCTRPEPEYSVKKKRGEASSACLIYECSTGCEIPEWSLWAGKQYVAVLSRAARNKRNQRQMPRTTVCEIAHLRQLRVRTRREEYFGNLDRVRFRRLR